MAVPRVATSRDLFLTAGPCVGDPEADSEDQPAQVFIWFTDGNQIIDTDPVYLANLQEQAANPDEDVDLSEGDEGYPCAGYDASGVPARFTPNGQGALTIKQTSDVGSRRRTELRWARRADVPDLFGVLAPVDRLATWPPDATVTGTSSSPWSATSSTKCEASRVGHQATARSGP